MKEIPVATIDVINRHHADIVILNEHTDGESREPFKAALGELGYASILGSDKIGRSNQVLIASRRGINPGEIAAPDLDDCSKTNFLHVVVPSIGLNIVGLRCPAYTEGKELSAYWDELRPIIDDSVSERIIFMGDFNGDPDGKRSPAGVNLMELCEAGWRVPAPDGEWSYISHNGKSRSRLDHVSASTEVIIRNARYVTEANGIIIAGTGNSNPISDHAILIVDILVP